MTPLLFTKESESALQMLAADRGRQELYERVNDVLDLIEDDPGNRVLRRRRYQQPPLWGVPVRGSAEDWLVTWGELPNNSGVYYIGPDL